MQLYQPEYIANLRRIAALTARKQPEGLPFADYEARMDRDEAQAEALVRQNMELLRGELFPVLDNLFQADRETLEELEAFAARHYPKARVAARWAAQDCMSLDGAPYVGLYSGGTSGLYVASGFNKWGMTSSMAAAMILTDMALGRDHPCAPAFDPSRTVLRPQLAVNGWESALGLLTPTAPRCPHMGCALKYNAAEHSWDCPCHGSRFGEDGTLIDNPATDDKQRM